MFRNYEEEVIRTLRDEFRSRGINVTNEQIDKVRMCINELRRRHVPLSQAREIAKLIAQVLSEVPFATLSMENIRQFLSMVSSCRLVGFQLRRHESIYCPIMIPRDFIGISLITVTTLLGNVTLLIKRVGEPISDNAYYAEDVILVGYFDVNNVVWSQRFDPGIYLVEVNNSFSDNVNVTIDVMTCILSTKENH
ncbi:hypothetical protein [Vulcanisaeta distributa]|uniref:Uncharacterized protein n=1 Tax=Vulcanisaeta distributa (strain DSM 14429 / JCM 11212 / NBRC 100878 / IC-017) TaxID=572478 RepID=E1QPG7_VULDI|nr:hypothetical protein [Vulcanisaeta distributa]ADN51455.1 hypothetical protein Vdis_2086 [Vulcanisaeta distributa DSM 14429]